MKVQGRSCGTGVSIAAAVALALGAPAAQAVEFGTPDGWNAAFDGVIHAFYVGAKNDTVAGAPSSAQESRFMSGFNPSKFNGHFTAPSYDGLKVSGNFQFASNLSGGTGTGQSSGAGNANMDVRVLDINLSGNWGTLAMGRSWAIFSGSAIVHDEGSGTGVGHLCGVAGAMGGGTCGRIGTGYTWTAFAPRIEYDTPNLGGFSARVGLFDPANGVTAGGAALQTKTPRLEAEGSYGGKFSNGGYKLWVGMLHQSLSAPASGGPSAKLQGVDTGVHVDVGGFGLTAAYASTKGFGATGFKFGGISCSATDCAVSKDKQMYLDASYKFVGKTRVGASTGRGKNDADTSVAGVTIDDRTQKHHMLYVHHDLTPQTKLTFEYDLFKSDSSNTALVNKYKVWVVGLNYFF